MSGKIENHLCFRVARASRRLMSIYERRCRSLGLTPVQLLVLGLLQEQNAATITDLATTLGFDASTMTRIIQRMVDTKLVERLADPGDRRVQRVYIHKDTKRRVKSLLAEADAIEAELSRLLSTEERESFETLLDRFSTIEQPPTEAAKSRKGAKTP